MPALRNGTLHVSSSQSKSTHQRAGRLAAVGIALCLSAAFGGAALADDCSADIAGLSKKRQELIDNLNKAAKTSPQGQLDPQVSCPKLRELSAAEQQLLAYMKKNKEWCSIPDDAVNNFSAASEKTKVIAAKACQVAEQIKKGLQAGAAQAPKLPTGPL